MSEYAYEHCPRVLAMAKLFAGFTVNDTALNELKYRWEFLRRNEGYVKDYNKSLKEVEGFRELGWLSETGFEELPFCKKWRVGVPVSPKKNFNQLRNQVEKEVNKYISARKRSLQDTLGGQYKEQFIRLFLESILKPVDYFLFPVSGWESFLFTDERDLLWITDKQYRRFVERGEMDFTINFNFSQRSITLELERMVKIFKKRHEVFKKEGMKVYKKLEEDNKKGEGDKAQLNRIKQIIKAQGKTEQQIKAQKIIPRDRKPSVKDEGEYFEDYLKVWDLHKKQMKWKQIAKNIFPEDFRDPLTLKETDPIPNPDNAERKVKHYFDNAKYLIDGMALGFTVFTRSKPYSF